MQNIISQIICIKTLLNNSFNFNIFKNLEFKTKNTFFHLCSESFS